MTLISNDNNFESTLEMHGISDENFQDLTRFIQGQATYHGCRFYKGDEEADQLKEHTLRRDIEDRGCVANARLIYCRQDESYIGYVFFTPCQLAEGRGLYMEDIFVEDAHRGKGAGEFVMGYLARQVCNADADVISWVVAGDNKIGQRFYSRRIQAAAPDETVYSFDLTQDLPGLSDGGIKARASLMTDRDMARIFNDHPHLYQDKKTYHAIMEARRPHFAVVTREEDSDEIISLTIGSAHYSTFRAVHTFELGATMFLTQQETEAGYRADHVEAVLDCAARELKERPRTHDLYYAVHGHDRGVLDPVIRRLNGEVLKMTEQPDSQLQPRIVTGPRLLALAKHYDTCCRQQPSGRSAEPLAGHFAQQVLMRMH